MSVSFSLPDLAELPLLIGYTVWWMHTLRRGARVRRASLALHTVVYGLLAVYVWAVSLGEIVRAGAASTPLTWLWTILLTCIAVGATEGGLWYGNRRIVFERTEIDGWHYRGPLAIALFWLALYLIRFSLEDGLLGGYSVFLPVQHLPASVPVGSFVAVVLVVASLYLTSFGFLLGISIVVWDQHDQAELPDVPAAAPSPGERPAEPSSPSDPARSAPAFVYTAPVVVPEEIARVSGGFRPEGIAAAAASIATAESRARDGSAPGAPVLTRCPKCGATGPGHGLFCGGCGQALPHPEPAASAGPSAEAPRPAGVGTPSQN